MSLDNLEQLDNKPIQSPRSLIAVHRLFPDSLLKKSEQDMFQREKTQQQNKLIYQFYLQNRDDLIQGVLSEFERLQDEGIEQEEFQFVGCPAHLQDIVRNTFMTTASTSQSFTITSNDNVINARLLKDKEIADKEAALNLKREKKMALLERRRQEAFDALEQRNAERRKLNEEKRKEFDSKMEAFQRDLDNKRLASQRDMQQREDKLKQMQVERQKQLSEEKAALEIKIQQKVVKVAERNELITSKKMEKQQEAEFRQRQKEQMLIQEEQMRVDEMRHKFQQKRAILEQRIQQLEIERTDNAQQLMQRIDDLDQRHESKARQMWEEKMSKIKKQQDELRDALKETIKRQQQEEIAYVQKAENNLQKRQMNEQSFLKRQEELQQERDKAIIMKQMQSEQRRMNAEMNRRSKEYSNQIVSQKLQNKDHKLQELIQQRMSTSNINFQKSIRMDAIKATEDPREKRRLMKLYFGVEQKPRQFEEPAE